MVAVSAGGVLCHRRQRFTSMASTAAPTAAAVTRPSALAPGYSELDLSDLQDLYMEDVVRGTLTQPGPIPTPPTEDYGLRVVSWNINAMAWQHWSEQAGGSERSVGASMAKLLLSMDADVIVLQGKARHRVPSCACDANVVRARDSRLLLFIRVWLFARPTLSDGRGPLQGD